MKIEINADVCRGCEACMLSCSLIHEGESNPLLSRVIVKKDMSRYKFQIVLCQQCQVDGDTPECIQACPAEAIRVDERGVVIIVDENCLRCGACVSACPYRAIFYNQKTDQYYKCDLCAGQDAGPLCVEICPVEALVLRNETLIAGGSA